MMFVQVTNKVGLLPISVHKVVELVHTFKLRIRRGGVGLKDLQIDS